MERRYPLPDPKAFLSLAIRTAQVVENAAVDKRLRAPLPVTGFGMLVRNRRLASAIARLSRSHAYEARIFMRSMLETLCNYAWIRLRKARYRARRFHCFWPLEQLKLLQKMVTVLKTDQYDALVRRYEGERRNVRHLFRYRDKNGKMQWARSWAAVDSVEARFAEILKKEKPRVPVDPFLYGMFISFSTATHGGPSSINDLLRLENDRLVAKPQPESNPSVHLQGAASLLSWTIEAFAEDAKLKHQLRDQLAPLNRITNALKEHSAKKVPPFTATL